MTLTAHFTWADVVASDKARTLGIDNSLPADLRLNAAQQADLLERVRAALSAEAGRDVSMRVSSWYRCPALNWAVRHPRQPWTGQEDATGDHPQGLATDFTAPAFGTPLDVCRFLAPRVDELGVGQLIYEGGWVHLSARRPSKAINRVISILPGRVAVGIVEG